MKLNQKGVLNALLIPLVLAVLLFFGALGFGIWAFSERQSYKYEVDQKIKTAVELARKETASAKDNEFVEKEKQPLKEFTGPAAFGSLVIKYPKTWSAYIDQQGDGGEPLDGYLNPDFVPVEAANSTYALRFQVVDNEYDEELERLESDIESGNVKGAAYRLPQVPNTLGFRVDGEIDNGKRGSLVILPVRDKTIKIWTESEQFVKDYNDLVLANLKFVP